MKFELTVTDQEGKHSKKFTLYNSKAHEQLMEDLSAIEGIDIRTEFVKYLNYEIVNVVRYKIDLMRGTLY